MGQARHLRHLVAALASASVSHPLDRPAAALYLTSTLINPSVNNTHESNRNSEFMADPLSVTLSALADPTRRAILARLVQGEATVNELAQPFDISLPAISRHLKVLESAGLISRGRDAQWRPCRLEAAPLRAVDDWLEHYRRFWAGSFDRMGAYLEKLQKGKSHGRKH